MAAAFLLIPLLGIRGAAITTTLTYTALFVYQWAVFHRITGIRLKQLVPNKADFDWIKAEIGNLLRRNSEE
jgi:O-antigen/teichoic acid export membrane protein